MPKQKLTRSKWINLCAAIPAGLSLIVMVSCLLIASLFWSSSSYRGHGGVKSAARHFAQ